MPIRAFSAVGVVALICTFLPAAAPPKPVDSQLVRDLIRQLDSDEFFARQKADEELRQLGKGAVGVMKTEMNKSKSLEVKWRLNRMISDLTISDRVGQLVKLLGDRDVNMRKRAEWTLKQSGPDVLPLLLDELRPEISREQRRQLEMLITELKAKQR